MKRWCNKEGHQNLETQSTNWIIFLYYFLLMYMMQYYWKSSVETGITEKHENSQSLQDKIVQERNNLRNKQKDWCVSSELQNWTSLLNPLAQVLSVEMFHAMLLQSSTPTIDFGNLYTISYIDNLIIFFISRLNRQLHTCLGCYSLGSLQ